MSRRPAVLALDQGTTSSRAIVFDRHGRPLSVAQREFRQIFPEPGRVEHDPEEIWRSQIEVAADAVGRAGNVGIEAIGITNQRETTIVWDRVSGEPVANAIVWQDRRTAQLCDALRPHEDLFAQRTGLVVDPYFSGTKIRWILDNVDGARRKAAEGKLAFGTVDSWLVWKLTGGLEHLTDVTNASRTLLFDIHRCDWDDELLGITGVPRSLLPRIVDSSGVVARTAAGLPLAPEIPIAGIAGDQQAALFGQRCVSAGMAKNTYGTGSFVVMNSGGTAVASKRRLLSTVAWKLPGAAASYALEGSIFVTGAAVQWLRDELGIIGAASEVEPLAASVADSGGVVFVPAFTGLGAPHWDPGARGTISGITRGTTAAHIARATLESIALQTADVLDAMRDDSGLPVTELRVDGGGAANDLLMQLQADLANVTVVRSREGEATSLGVAWLAGLAAGVWTSGEELDAQWTPDRTFEPRMRESERAAARERWSAAVAKARA
jgi:glycerol kinase